MGIGCFGRLDDLCQCGILSGKTDVVQDTAGEEEGFLQDNAQLGMKTFGFDGTDIVTVKGNLSLIGIIQTHDQIDQSGFSGAGSAYRTDHFSRFYGK